MTALKTITIRSSFFKAQATVYKRKLQLIFNVLFDLDTHIKLM